MNTFVGLILMILVWTIDGQKNPYWLPGRSTIVHLFEWQWADIAAECENFLGPMGFAGVQVSPPTENVIVPNRPWYERYQPISYGLTTRSGDQTAFADMVQRCSMVGVRIYVDLVVNHMNAHQGVGTGGSKADVGQRQWPAVPYNVSDFNPHCDIENYKDPVQVRNCSLVGLPDLNQGSQWVRERIVELMNKLLGLGVAGFRMDAVKHMWPADLEAIYNSVNVLNTAFNFPADSKPFIYQEVIDLGEEPIKMTEYTHLGAVTEFKHSAEIGRLFRGKNALAHLNNWGEPWNLLTSADALVFVDNHDNQRGHGAGGADILTYKNAKQYKMATAFMLAYPYGIVRVMSSFEFTDPNQGPPADASGALKSPEINPDGSCGGGWVCEHRWREVFAMVKFRNEVGSEPVTNWWSNGNSQISFCRGHSGFVAFNNEATALNEKLQTCLPAGTYCDVISGEKKNNQCTGKTVEVNADGTVQVSIAGDGPNGVLAIHKGVKTS